MHPSATLPRRRNGRLQACEPCRRRKISCDHELPVCRRCRQRKMRMSCVYMSDNGPLNFDSQPASVATPEREQAETTELSADHDIPDAAHSEHPSASSTRCSHSPSNPLNPQCSAPHEPLSWVSRKSGYLGASSFSAVFHGTRGNVPSNNKGNLAQSTSTGTATMPNTTLDKAIGVLGEIPGSATAETLLRASYQTPNDHWNRLAVKQMMNSLWDTFGVCLQSRRQAGLREMARILTHNSSLPLNEKIRDPQEWIASFSGRNMRWECLGILFGQWALGSIHYDEDKSQGSETLWRDVEARRSTMRRYMDMAEACTNFAEAGNVPNTLIVHLMLRRCTLESMSSGDASKSTHLVRV